MQSKTFAFVTFLLCCDQNHLANGRAFLGENVKAATAKEFTFTVCLIHNNNTISIEKNIFCSGVLITKFHVLTSEHCFDEVENNSFKVLIGSNNLRRARKYMPLYWLSFDQWSVSKGEEIDYSENDVATLKLIERVPDKQAHVSLASFTDNINLYGSRVVATGWGVLSNDQFPTFLQKVVLKIMPNDVCEMKLNNLSGEYCPVPEVIYFCTEATPYIHLGEGDSGGPLLLNNKLIGVNKAICPGIDFDPEQVNAHVSINYYRRFIAITTQE